MDQIKILPVYFAGLAYFVYLLVLVRKKRINLIDFFFNSIMCIVPPIYITFYSKIAKLLLGFGIETPFLVLFGSFLFLVFLYVSRIVILLHDAEKKQMRMLEEFALMDYRLRRSQRKAD
jgi:hypothetical protein